MTPLAETTPVRHSRLDALVARRVESAMRARELWHDKSRRAVRMPAPVLIYHAVSHGSDAPADPYVLSEQRFREHLDVLAASGLETVRLADIAGQQMSTNAVALTFDDGCLSWVQRIAPLLAERQMRAAFFVIADRKRSPRGSIASPDVLSWAELRDIAAIKDETRRPLFEIGCHGLQHVDLSERIERIGAAALRDELRHAREIIEAHVDQPCRALALPGGKAGLTAPARSALRRAAADAGYTLVRDSRPRYDRCPRTSYLGGTPVYQHTTPAMLRFELFRVRRQNWLNAAQWTWLRGRGKWIERNQTSARATSKSQSSQRAVHAASRPQQLTWHMPRLMQCGCGMSRRVRDLAAGLHRRGHAVRFVVPSDATDLPGERIDDARLLRIDVPADRVLHWSLQARMRQRRAAWIARAIGDPGDAVLTCQPEFAAAWRASNPAQPIVLVACCTQLLYESGDRAEDARFGRLHRAARGVNRLLMRAAERRGFRAASAVAFDSPMTRDLVAAAYHLAPERCHVTAPTVDVQRFSPVDPAERQRLRRTLGLPECGFVVCWTGRLEDRKNLELLIDATALARDAVQCVVLVGDGADRPGLEARAAQRGLAGVVRFEGMQAHVEPYLRAADAFVLPSLVESFGIALIEAMACGLPCIGLGNADAAVRSNAAALIDNGRTGFLLLHPAAELLAAKLRTLAGDEALRRRLGDAGRRRVVAQFAAGRDGRQLEQLIDALLHN